MELLKHRLCKWEVLTWEYLYPGNTVYEFCVSNIYKFFETSECTIAIVSAVEYLSHA